MPGPLEVYPGNNVLLVMAGEENCTLVFSNNLKNEGQPTTRRRITDAFN
jgi:hypothetical protein